MRVNNGPLPPTGIGERCSQGQPQAPPGIIVREDHGEVERIHSPTVDAQQICAREQALSCSQGQPGWAEIVDHLLGNGRVHGHSGDEGGEVCAAPQSPSSRETRHSLPVGVSTRHLCQIAKQNKPKAMIEDGVGAENDKVDLRRELPDRAELIVGRPVRLGSPPLCGRPYYRCQIHRDAPDEHPEHPATIYVREEAILPSLDSWLAELFTDEQLDNTCQALADASEPDADEEARRRQIRAKISKLDTELDSYRTIVRTEPEAATTVGRWIADTNQERRRLETLLGRKPTTKLTKDDIKALVASLRDITATLAAADPADKAAVYAEMGIDITYHRDGRVVVESRPRVVESGVGERTRTSTGC